MFMYLYIHIATLLYLCIFYIHIVMYLCLYICIYLHIYKHKYLCTYVCRYSHAGCREQSSREQRHAVGADVCAPSILDADAQDQSAMLMYHMPSAMPMHTCRRRCRWRSLFLEKSVA